MLKHIAILGGSFDPPHLGHLAIIQDFLTQKRFDEVWLVPVFHHPFAKSLTQYEHRLHMLQLLVQNVQNPALHICEIEKELCKTTSYFYDTLVALQQQNPNHHFHIIVGSDVKASLSQWHKIDELQKIADFEFVPRQGYEKSPYPQISSTTIRQSVLNHTPLDDMLLPAVKDYIAKHKLYF